MKKKILFVVSSNYQLMISYIINYFLKSDYETILLCSSTNEYLNTVAKKIGEEKFSRWKVVRKMNRIQNIKTLMGNKSINSSVLNFLQKIAPDQIIIFKDNDSLNLSVINFGYKKKINITLIQEGIGIYEKPNIQIGKIFKAIVKKVFLYPPSYAFVQGCNSKVKSIAVTNPELLPEPKKRNKKIINMPKKLPPKIIMDELLSYFNIDESIFTLINNGKTKVLYLGQPLVEVGLTTIERENTMLQDLNKLVNRLGLQFIIKMHPYEKKDKYFSLFNVDTKIIEGYIPAELLPYLFDPLCILTPISSAAENISLWYGIPSIYLSNLVINNPLKFDTVLNGKKIRDINDLYQKIFEIKRLKKIRESDTDSYLSYKNFVSNLII